MNIISCCPTCAEKLCQTHHMVETDTPPRLGMCQWCMPPRTSVLKQYEMTPKKQIRRRPKPAVPRRKDRRAFID